MYCIVLYCAMLSDYETAAKRASVLRDLKKVAETGRVKPFGYMHVYAILSCIGVWFFDYSIVKLFFAAYILFYIWCVHAAMMYKAIAKRKFNQEIYDKALALEECLKDLKAQEKFMENNCHIAKDYWKLGYVLQYYYSKRGIKDMEGAIVQLQHDEAVGNLIQLEGSIPEHIENVKKC